MRHVLRIGMMVLLFAGCEKEELMNNTNLNKGSSLKGAQINEIRVPGDYPTIQEAVDHAVNGTVIYVTGTFAEYVRINDLTDLKLIGEDALVRQPDLNYYRTYFRFENCRNFELRGFTVDGDDSQMDEFDPAELSSYNGIRVINSTGKIIGNTFLNMVAHLKPGGDGNVILISNAKENSEVFILNNKFENFFFLGIASWGHSFLKIDGNEFISSRENRYTKCSCINPMGGSAIITNNKIYGCPNPQDVHELWIPPDVYWGMVGIDINDTRNVLVSGNVVTHCNPAIYFGDFQPQEYALENTRVLNNRFYENTLNVNYYQCSEPDITWGKNLFE